MDFSLTGPSVGGSSTRDALVTMVEKVAETGDESNSPSVITSTNSVLTATVSVLLAIGIKEDDQVESSCSSGLFLVRDRCLFCFVYIYVQVIVSVFFSLYRPIGKDPSCVIVDIDLCKFGACFRHLRRPFQIPMSLQ